MAGSPTALAKLGFGPADPVVTALNFSQFDPGVTRELGNYNGTRGTFFPDGNRMRENRQAVNPRFTSEPTAAEIATLLEWIQGGTPTGTTTKTYPWSDTPLKRNLHFKPKVGEEWFLGGVAVGNAVIAATVGQALSFDLDCIGMTWDDTRTDFPALSYDQALQPFMLSDLALLVGGVTRRPRDFTFTSAGGIDRDRYLNSLTLTDVLRVAGNWTVSFSVPSGDNASGFWRSGIVGATCTATFTNTSTAAVLTLDFPKIFFPGQSPVHAPGGEGFVTVNGLATRVGAGSPVTITLNPGA